RARRAAVPPPAAWRIEMSKATSIVCMLVALAVGFWLGTYTEKNRSGSSDSASAASAPGNHAAAPTDNVERFRVPLNASPIHGPETAKVTIVEFSDFQCPFCGRVIDTVHQLEKAYSK